MIRLKVPATYRGLPKSVYVLFFANAVNSLGNFVWPFLTLFLTDRLGMSRQAAGFFVTLSLLATTPGSLLGGKLADHWGRRKVFLLARLTAALLLVPCAFLGDSRLVPWLLLTTSFFWGACDPPLAAMVADVTDRHNRQTAYSLLYLGHNLGFSIGPMVAGLLYQKALPWIFLGDALTSLVSVALVWRMVPETHPDRQVVPAVEDGGQVAPHAGAPGEQAEAGGLVAALLRRPALMAFAMVLMVYSFVYNQSVFSLPLQMEQFFAGDGARRYGTLMSLNAVTVVLLTTWVVKHTRRFAPVRNVAAAGLLYAAGFGLVALGRFPLVMVVSTLIWTLGEIMVTTNHQAYVANHAPATHRARFASAIEQISGAGFALAPLVTGRVIDQAGLAVVWPAAAVLAAIASILMGGLWLRESPVSAVAD